ncbi:splicing regulator ARVCF-like isoform X3 [Ostrea edulis]|uniref:splicing regulator ARVCF-like isoform X3 n=1 Tax=Ostrea edulis TaxID=37623 RepID=UPI0024AFD0F6|nr:splicing regulator ARVCF-like isoform X3 [Ostrea edulis]
MPAGPLDQDSFYQNTPIHTPDRILGNESSSSLLKSIKAQEAQFKRITQELKTEQGNHRQYIAGTGSMTSFNTTEDSLPWQSPRYLTNSRIEDDSFVSPKMNSHLLDSCMRELEDRGTFGADNMDFDNFAHENSYGGHDPGMYSSDPYGHSYSPHLPNGGQYYQDERSPHGSRVSLQSGDGHRNLSRMDNKHVGPGSMGSLHRQEPPQDNYASYSSLTRPPYEEDPQGSPRGPTTPIRFNGYQDPPYSSGGRYSVASNDSLRRADPYSIYDPRDGPPRSRGSYDQSPPYGSNQHISQDPRYADHPANDHYGDLPGNDRYGDLPGNDRYGDLPGNDRYGDLPSNDHYGDQPGHDPYGDHPSNDRFSDPHNDSRVSDSFYRDSPDRNDLYPRNGPHHDNYQDFPPEEGRLHDPSYIDDRYKGYPDEPGNYRESPDPRSQGYRDEGPPEDKFHSMSLNDPPGNYPPNHSYLDIPQNQSFDQRGPMDRYGEGGHGPGDRYGDVDHGPEDRYGDVDRGPGDRYGDGNPGLGDRYGDEQPTFGDYDDQPYRKHEGLPPVHSDPFADDPFQQQQMQRSRTPTSVHDQYGGHNDHPPMRYDDRYSNDGRGTPQRGMYDDNICRSENVLVNAPSRDHFSDGRHTPSVQGDGNSWRPPDLQEVIDYLSHPNKQVKANAAAYLQHLCYTDQDIKVKTRGLDGIPPLVELLHSDYPEVQKNACGALKNLSYGRGPAGTDNKKAIANAGGITELIRLIRKECEEEIKELVTGILWNLSSCEELKPNIIAEGLPDIVNHVIIPYSGHDRRKMISYEPWTTVYKNATGIIRNLSSANKDDEQRGYDTRNKLRESSRLVTCLIYTLKISKDNRDRENKIVENCMCALRNLSFRIQEVTEQDFYRKRTETLKRRQQPDKETTGCFGGGGNKKKGAAAKKGKPDLNQNAERHLPPGAQEFQGLWQQETVTLYLDILKESSNPVTVEAAVGAIQNLTACYWKFADDARALVRIEKGLPSLVDLLGQDRDDLVCHAALALRNLAIDERNKELIGKYALKPIINTLPQEKQKENVPDKTICAAVALLHELLKNSVDFAQMFVKEKGIPRLKFVKFAPGKFLKKTKDHTQRLLENLWEFKSLHGELTVNGLTEQDVKTPPTASRPPDKGATPYNTPYSTMSRGMESHGYDDNTLSPGRPMNKPYQPSNGGYHSMVQGHSNPAMNVEEPYPYDDRMRGDDIPMRDIGYAPLDDDRRERKTPVGGVPLFPGLQPQQQAQPQPMAPGGEPLYAQVNKNKRRDDLGHGYQVNLGEPGSPPGGADSWV